MEHDEFIQQLREVLLWEDFRSLRIQTPGVYLICCTVDHDTSITLNGTTILMQHAGMGVDTIAGHFALMEGDVIRHSKGYGNITVTHLRAT